LTCMAQNAVLGLLNPADREHLARLARRRDLSRGEVLCHQGYVWPRVALLVQGTGQWCLLSPSGRRQVVFRMGPSDVVWGHSLFDHEPLPASFEMVTDGYVYWWTQEDIVPVLSKHVDAVWALSREMVRWMRRVREVLYSLAFQSVAHRVARLLLDYYPECEGRPVPRDLTLEEMADMVGTSPEFVCRVLKRLAHEGILRVGRRYFVFLDRQRLAALAQEDGRVG